MSASPVQRVVVTGIGLIAPWGIDRESNWRHLLRGDRALRWLDADDLTDGDDGVPRSVPERPLPPGCRAGAPVRLPGESAGEPVIELARLAASAALADAGLSATDASFDRDRCGCVIGSSKGGLRSFERAWRQLRRGGPDAVDPQAWRGFLPESAAIAVAQQHDLRGPLLCPVAACATGLASLFSAWLLIRSGQCDAVLAGSSDASLRPAVLASFQRLGVLADRFDDPSRAVRPFAADRCGFLVGEGAAVLTLESAEHAQGRGAVPYAELLGFGAGSDASGLIGLDESAEPLTRVICDALRRSDVAADELDFVQLHGTGTLANDRTESRAVRAALGRAADRVACSGSKGGIGHLLGAAGSVETAATVLALRDGLVPPTVNLDRPAADCDLDFATGAARARPLATALKLSLGFGGHLFAVVIRRDPSGRAPQPAPAP